MRRPNLGLALGLAYWSTVSSPHFGLLKSEIGTFLAAQVLKKSPFWSRFRTCSGLARLVFRCTCYWPTGTKGFPLSRHDTQHTSPIAVRARSRVHAENMADESRYRKTVRQKSLHLRHGALHAADMVMRHLYVYSPGTYQTSSIITRRAHTG